MILKSYEIQRNPSNLLKYNVFLLYGENSGLKKDIKESIKTVVSQQDTNIELLSLYENDIIDNVSNYVENTAKIIKNIYIKNKLVNFITKK